MHPKVKPALRRGWRDSGTAQYGMTAAHALTLGPIDVASAYLLELMDGTRGLPLLRAEGRRMELPEGRVDDLVAGLADSGLLDDARGGGPEAQALRRRPEVMERLAPDLAALSLVCREPGGALGLLAARRRLRVQVRGAGRVGAAVAALLSAAGVGEVEVMDGGSVTPQDVAPGGLPAEAVGEQRSVAARRVVRAAAAARLPRRTPGPAAGPGEPGFALVVLAPRDDVRVHAPDPADAGQLMAAGVPHLYAGVVEGTGVVGPLVLPGETGCAGCLEQARADRDPMWPRLVAQWRSGRRRPPVPCDVALAATVAGLAASHALAFLDGLAPSGVGRRWEVSAPALTWRERPVAAHPGCGCGAAREGKEEHTPEEGESHETMAGRRHVRESCRTTRGARPAGTWRAQHV